MKSKRNRKKKQRLYLLAGTAALVVLVMMLVLTVQGYKKLSPASGVQVDPTYSALNVSWESIPGADGYYVYATQGEATELVGETEGKDSCSYAFKDYTRDQKYEISVVGYKKKLIGGGKREGKLSEPISVVYDSTQYAQQIPILTYHKIIPAGREFKSSLLIAADTFDKQMKYLHDNGFTTITPEEFYEWHEGKKEFPVKTCMITFDDGFAEVYYLAYPIIRKYGLSATLFCIGHHIEDTTEAYDPDAEDAQYIGRDAIEEVRKEYPDFVMESHTYAMHSRVNGKKPAVAFTYDQIMEDCELNKPFGFKYLAYPWGTYSETMQQALKDSGYKMAFTYDPFYYATRDDDPYAVNRIKINGKIAFDKFVRIVNIQERQYDPPQEQ